MSFSAVQTAMAEAGYMASDDLAVALHLAISLQRPILLEGAAGVGKTEVARVLATVQKTKLIRLQCYEGLDAAQAIYEWNYQRQLLAIRSSAEAGETGSTVEKRIFSEEFLLERPLLAAIRQPQSPVLLIDEIDRADEEFEAYLLEILADFQITVEGIFGVNVQVAIESRSVSHCNRSRRILSVRRDCVDAAFDQGRVGLEYTGKPVAVGVLGNK